MDFDVEIFKGKTFSELMKDIYSNSTKKDRQINMLIGELRPLIKNIGDATVIVPLIKEYLEVGVKNNRVQTETGNSWILSEEEKKQLLGELDELTGADKIINEKVVSLSSHQTQIEAEINDIQDGLV